MKPREEIDLANKVILILGSADYIDLEENIYDSVKFLKVYMRRGETLGGSLKDLYVILKDGSSFVSHDGKCEEVELILKEKLNI